MVYINNCVNKILMTQFVWYFEKKKRYDIKTESNDKVLIIQKSFMKPPKLVPDSFLFLVINPQQPLYTRNYLKK